MKCLFFALILLAVNSYASVKEGDVLVLKKDLDFPRTLSNLETKIIDGTSCYLYLFHGSKGDAEGDFIPAGTQLKIAYTSIEDFTNTSEKRTSIYLDTDNNIELFLYCDRDYSHDLFKRHIPLTKLEKAYGDVFQRVK